MSTFDGNSCHVCKAQEGSVAFRLEILWAQVREEFRQFGYFLTGGGLSERQSGVFRTNCIDCLDRTNVVQGVLARKHLTSLLQKLSLLSDSETLPSRYPKARARPHPFLNTLQPAQGNKEGSSLL